MTWFNKLKLSLGKTSAAISVGISKIFTHAKLSEADIAEFEDLLISSDLGTNATDNIIQELERRKFNKSMSEQDARDFLSSYVANAIRPMAKPLFSDIGWPLFISSTSANSDRLTAPGEVHADTQVPRVLMMCGVNGNGKTTTSGKIAYRMNKLGYGVMLAACDTFRAAAVEQLQVWVERSGCGFVRGQDGADAASVAYNAVQRAVTEKIDLLILDTAGRLHNKVNLMDELKKIKRVVHGVLPDAPHDIILVIDGTTGQNAYQQIETFHQAIGLNGIIITKLDSSAKGGFIVGMAQKYNIPIRAVGVGEDVDDLDALDPDAFAQGLVGS